MLAYADELRTKVRVLLDDVGPLSIVSGIGFNTDDPALLAANLRSLSAGPWSFLVLDSEPTAARTALVSAWQAPEIVVFVPSPIPRPLVELVRAFIDRRDQVDLGDFEKRTRRTDQSLVLLVKGAVEAEEIPQPLRRVPAWEFIP